MRVKVELHPDVYAYLAGLSPAERDDFVARLNQVRERPIKTSERHSDVSISPYVLRRFEFGLGVAKVAIFEFDAFEGRMRVLKCRPRRPRKLLRSEPDADHDAPGPA